MLESDLMLFISCWELSVLNHAMSYYVLIDVFEFI